MLKSMYKKYLILGIIFILLAVNGSSSLSVNTSINLDDVIDHNENLTVCIEKIKDGRGLTVEICNNEDFDVENIQLNVDVENGKLVFIPKKTYEIPFLAAGDSTEVHIVIFGFRPGLLLGYPLVTIKASAPVIETFWKIISTSIIGTKTKIIEELSFSGDPYEGYTLFGPEYSKYTYLLDMDGKIVHYWKSNYIQGFGGYLLENGELLRLDLPLGQSYFHGGGVAGRVEKFDEDSNILWEFEYSNQEHCAHHDIEPLPNGNVLLIAWELKSKNEAIAAGRNPDRLRSNDLWPDHIIEVQPVGSNGGNIVWEWHLWDHLIQDYDSSKENYGIVEDHPELVDINYGNTDSDWTHTNAIDYNEELDQIVISVHNFNEIWIIDHSTTTQEAKGHTGGRYSKGGDLLYRWGNPQAFRAGNANDQRYFGQHGVEWVEKGCPGEGNILVFNNGNRNRGYSTVDEIIPPIDESGNYIKEPGQAYGPDEAVWVYSTDKPSHLFSQMLSNAQRLPNGNTLICSANQGWFIEVSPDKNIVWQYKNILPSPLNNAVARVHKYPKDFPGIPEVRTKEVIEI